MGLFQPKCGIWGQAGHLQQPCSLAGWVTPALNTFKASSFPSIPGCAQEPQRADEDCRERRCLPEVHSQEVAQGGGGPSVTAAGPKDVTLLGAAGHSAPVLDYSLLFKQLSCLVT